MSCLHSKKLNQATLWENEAYDESKQEYLFRDWTPVLTRSADPVMARFLPYHLSDLADEMLDVIDYADEGYFKPSVLVERDGMWRKASNWAEHYARTMWEAVRDTRSQIFYDELP